MDIFCCLFIPFMFTPYWNQVNCFLINIDDIIGLHQVCYSMHYFCVVLFPILWYFPNNCGGYFIWLVQLGFQEIPCPPRCNFECPFSSLGAWRCKNPFMISWIMGLEKTWFDVLFFYSKSINLSYIFSYSI